MPNLLTASIAAAFLYLRLWEIACFLLTT